MTRRICAGGPAVLLVVVCLASIALAQSSWWRSYGGTDGEEANCVQQTTDGGYIVAGWTYSFGAGDRDVYLVKTNASGDTLWTRTYGGLPLDEGYSVQQTTDGGYIVAGRTYSFGAGNSDVYLIKTNALGDTLWTRTYGGSNYDEGNSVQQTSDSGYIVTGRTFSFGAGTPDSSNVYLIKTNAQGVTLWTRTYGGSSDDEGNSVQQTTDGGYVIAGLTASFGAGLPDVYLVRTNASGDTLWTRTYGGPRYDPGFSVQQTTDGGYVIVGYTYSFGPGTPTFDNIYLVKTNASGDTLWTRTYGGSSDDEGNSVRQTTDGGYIITGHTYSFGPGTPDYGNVYLVKTSASGDTLWTRTEEGTDDDWGKSAQQTTDGGYIVAGWTYSFGAGEGDVYLIKTDSLGNVGVAEVRPITQAADRKLAATVVRCLPQSAIAFDAMGRRALLPKPGIYFVRTTATAAPRKVLLVK